MATKRSPEKNDTVSRAKAFREMHAAKRRIHELLCELDDKRAALQSCHIELKNSQPSPACFGDLVISQRAMDSITRESPVTTCVVIRDVKAATEIEIPWEHVNSVINWLRTATEEGTYGQ